MNGVADEDTWRRVVDAVAAHSRFTVGPNDPPDVVAQYAEEVLRDHAERADSWGDEW